MDTKSTMPSQLALPLPDLTKSPDTTSVVVGCFGQRKQDDHLEAVRRRLAASGVFGVFGQTKQLT